MIDAFGIMVALMLFVAALIFTLMDWAVREYNDFRFEKKKLEWEIQFAQREGDEKGKRKNEFLKGRLIAEYQSYTLLYCIVIAILIIALLGIVVLMGNTLPLFAQIQQNNENPQVSGNLSCACQNNTYMVNNYYYNYTIEQIMVENKNRAFSLEELKYFVNNGKGTIYPVIPQENCNPIV